MKFSSLSINTNRSDKDKIRLCFWVYLFFLIFEGAFRKWILPEASNLFLVIREPIVLYVLFLGFKNNLFRNGFGKFFLITTILSFFISLTVGHQNLLVALYGFRITGLHIPALFVWGMTLRRRDLILIGKSVLYGSVLMCIIIAWQYFTPQSSWINRGVAGDVEGSGFSGAGGYFRPSGTFSFITGMIGFELLAGSFLLYFLYNNKHLKPSDQLSKAMLVLFFATFIASMFLCLSRSVIAGTAVLVLFCFASSFILKKKIEQTISIILLAIIAFILLYQIPFFKLAFDNMALRFDNAANSEGDFIKGSMGNRMFGSFTRAFTDTQNFTGKEIPFWGFGLGSGSKAGSILLNLSLKHSFGIAEEEWSLIICERGILLGGAYLLIGRLIFPFYYTYKAFVLLKRNNDYLPFMFSPFIIIGFLTHQLSPPTILGFVVVAGSIMMAAIRTSKKQKI